MTKTETIELTKEQRKLIVRMTHAITRLDNHDGNEFFEYLPTEGDVGARDLLNGSNHKVTEIVCPGNGNDIDTFKDLEQWS